MWCSEMSYPKIKIGETRFISTGGHTVEIRRIPHYKLSKFFPAECDIYLFNSPDEMANRLDVLIGDMVYAIACEYYELEHAAKNLGIRIKEDNKNETTN